MKNKLLKTVLCVLIISLLTGILPVSAKEYFESVDEAQNFIDSIVAFKLNEANAASEQNWINGALTENAGISSEWFVIALRQNGDFDFSSYEKALSEYLSEKEVSSPSSREKYALALIASGSYNEYITEVLNNSVGEQGIMSWIFGLHILNNGYVCDNHTAQSVTEKLLSLQLSDGGFAITGENGDVDTTAMAVQALAPYYDDETVKSAIDKALSFLSEKQNETGGYSSRGVENVESSAQVLVALSSLGIDCKTDERFIKNGNTLFDDMERYQLADGSFCHQIGKDHNNMATAQVFYSSVAYLRMTEGKSPLYIFETEAEANPKDESFQESSVVESDSVSEEGVISDIDEESEKAGYKVWVCLGIGIVAVMICPVMFLVKKRNGKNFLFVIAVAVTAILFVIFTNFQTTDDYYKNSQTSKENTVGKVTLTIRCDTVAGESSHIPENGIILDLTEFDIEEGDTVYDVLLEATSKNKIHLETNGNSEMIYVEGIANIYEFEFGDLSGWIYHVNGEDGSVSCGEYKVKAGDNIEWFYTRTLGEDVK